MPPVLAAIGGFLSTIGAGSAAAGAATLGSLASTGVSLGEAASHGGGGTPTTPTPTQQSQTADQVKKQLSSLVNQNQGTVNRDLSFGLSPEYAAQQVQTTTGVPDLSSLQNLISSSAAGSWSPDLSIGQPSAPGAGGLV